MSFRSLLVSLVIFCTMTLAAAGQSTEFTYQGKLSDGGVPANGSYDLQFRLFDDPAAGTQLGQTISVPAVTVVQGIFTVRIDFGNRFDGSARFLEISVRPTGNPGGYQQLLPRQPVTSAPYAIQSIVAATAMLAIDSTKLGGVEAGQYVQTVDPRMSDPRDPLPGSPNYIQNRAGPQPADFNITGNGTVGSTFSANVVNSQTQFNINGSRAFGYGNLSSLFIGNGAGAANTTGDSNTFAGINAGAVNTDGYANSFFGRNSGNRNTSGNGNTFIGANVGGLNTVGSNNTFVGDATGRTNTVGSFNTLIGRGASVDVPDLTYATAIGAGSFVDTSNTVVIGRILDRVVVPNSLEVLNSVQIGGELRANGSLLTSLNASNVSGGILSPTFGGTGLNSSGAPGNFLRSDGFIWRSARIEPADLPDLSGSYIRSSVNQQVLANFNIDGDGTVGGTLSGGTVNAVTEYRFNGFRAISFGGTDNTFVGLSNGSANTNGIQNTFVGTFAGNSNTDGSYNSFFGTAAGNANAAGNRNSFFGNGAGQLNTASFNSFFGNASGNGNVSGAENSFFGNQSGIANTDGSRNSFFGADSGFRNTLGYANSFFGYGSGSSTTTGYENTFVGYNAGAQNRGGQGNSFIGYETGSRSDGAVRNTLIGFRADSKGLFNPVTNGTAIGAFAFVERDNSIVLGAVSGLNGANFDTNVGIGTTAPANRLHVVGDASFIGNFGIGTTTPSAALDISVNGGRIQFGGAGCGAGFTGVGFAASFNSCENYSVLGNGTDTVINRSTGGTLYFRQGNVDDMRLETNGNLTVEGSQYVNRNLFVTQTVTAGYVTVNNLSPGGSTQVCRAVNNTLSTCSSSLRYKDDLRDFQGGLDVLRRLRPVTFRWKADNSLDLGFGAEDVAAVEPLLATYNEKGEVEGVKYDRLSTVFVNAFKEQQVQIEGQQKQIESQQKQIELQQRQLESQQKQIELLTKLMCGNTPKAEVCREDKR